MDPVVVTATFCVTARPVAVNEDNGVVPPTMPLNRAVPVVPHVRVSALAPFTVLLKVMFAPPGDPPALVVSSVAVAPITAEVETRMGPPLVVIFAPIKFPPAVAVPLKVTPPVPVWVIA